MAKLPYTSLPGSRILIGAGPSEGRTQVEDWLRGWGHQVEVAESGSSLLEMLHRAEPPAIVIVDTTLRGLNGMALVHQLQQQSSRQRSWTIVLSDAANPSEAILSGNTRLDDLLTKPVSEFELRVCIHTALRIETLYTEMMDSIEAARFRATRDGLTGLWNRESVLGLIFQETDRVQRLGTPLAFLLLDLDRFAEVNRLHGYDGGDNLLRQLASRFRRHLRSYDVIGRCGDDQFLIAMPGGTVDDARTMAARLRECIAERPFDLLKASVKVTASIGIAMSCGRSPLVVLREAENALCQAKLTGRDCVRFFDPGLAERESRSNTWSEPTWQDSQTKPARV